MKKSRRQAGSLKRGKDLDLSIRFESRTRKRLARRKGEKAGRKASRRGGRR